MDYGEQDVDYFADQIKSLNLDVICLQESQTKPGDSLTKKLAAAVDMPYWVETEGCPSHIDRNYSLTSAIISRLPFNQTRSVLLPRPEFELRFAHNGRIVLPYDRYVIKADFADYTIATLHTEPLGSFGLDYTSGVGKTLAEEIDETLCNELDQPLLFAGDFNTNNILKSFPKVMGAYDLWEVFGAEPTRPDKGRTDHIACSLHWTLNDSGIVQTQTDHYLCWAALTLR